MKKYFLSVLFIFCFLLISCSSKVEQKDTTNTTTKETNFSSKNTESKHQIYAAILNSKLGPITYYNQNDIRWYDYLYGKKDPLSIYGCGPTAVACLVSSFIDPSMTPDKVADWAYKKGYWASKEGSYHSLMSSGLSSYGFQVRGISSPSKEEILSSLNSGHILVALMGKGHFTSEGHFILILDVTKDGDLLIADVNSYENTKKPWKIETIVKELKKNATANGPLWEVSLPEKKSSSK